MSAPEVEILTRPDAKVRPVMDAVAWILLYAMHLTAIEWEAKSAEGHRYPVSDTIKGAITVARNEWQRTTGEVVHFNAVWDAVAIAWDNDCGGWWPEVRTLDDFDDAADYERRMVLRAAFNRYTGIREAFRPS